MRLRGVLTGAPVDPRFHAPVADDLPQGSIALIEGGRETLAYLGSGRASLAAPA